jgi:acetylornithine deacetylase/succinyl-diaminopimelate desuccinylase-like protein
MSFLSLQRPSQTWTHPPFSGFFDGKLIWSRGSSDDKNQLVAIFEAVELLARASFQPERTVLISLGFDEESAGTGGAGSIVAVILERYVPKSIATVIDEGSSISGIWGLTFASPGVAEKGIVNVVVTIRLPGGHSSVPPPHTSIGVISELIYLLKGTHIPHISISRTRIISHWSVEQPTRKSSPHASRNSSIIRPTTQKPNLRRMLPGNPSLHNIS